MIVDTHTHAWNTPDEWGPQISALLRASAPAPEELDSTVAGLYLALEDADAAFVLGFRSKLLGARIPDAILQACLDAMPDKLVAFAGVDPMEDGYLDAIAALPALRMRGVVVSPSEQGFHPLHSRAVKLYEKCVEMRMPLVVHQGGDYVSHSMLEHAQPLHLDAVARDFPTLKVLLTHCGHPFTDQALALLGKHENVYTEIGGLTARPRQLYQVLLMAHQLGVIGKVLLGSDFPRQTPRSAIEAVYSLTQLAQGAGVPTVPRQALRAIVERDAISALGLPPLAGPRTPRGDAGSKVHSGRSATPA